MLTFSSGDTVDAQMVADECALVAGDADARSNDLDNASVSAVDQSNGIPSAEINGLAQDGAGYLWASTPRGLARWDGNEIVVVDADPLTEPTLSAFLTTDVEPAAEGGVWVASDTLQRVSLDTNEIVDSGVGAGDIAVDNDLIWAVDDNMIRLFDSSTSEVVTETELPEFDTLTGPLPLATTGDHAVIGTSDGVIIVGRDGDLEVVDVPLGVGAVAPRSAGGVWLASGSGIYRFHPATGVELDHDLAPVTTAVNSYYGTRQPLTFRTAMVERSDGTVWIGVMPAGVAIYEPARSSFSTAETIGARPESPEINTMIEDRQGALWLTDHLTALLRVSPQRSGFGTIRLPSDGSVPTGTPFDQAWFDGHHWVAVGGPTGGLIQLSPEGELVASYQHDVVEPTSLPVNQTIALLAFGGALWVGHGADGGVSILDHAGSGKFRHLTTVERGGQLRSGLVFSMFAHNDLAYVSAWNAGLQAFNAAGEEVAFYGPDGGFDGALTTVRGMAVGDGWIVVGGVGGLQRLHLDTQRVENWGDDPSAESPLFGDIVFDVLADGPTAQWLATSAGLERVDWATGEHGFYGSAVGAPPSSAVFVYPDASGNGLWVGTERGLARFDIDAERFGPAYGRDDGLPDDAFTSGKPAIRPDGAIVASTAAGTGVILPFAPCAYPYLPEAQVRDIEASNGAVFDDGTYRVDANPDIVTVSFGALEFERNEALRFEYRLEGVHDWTVSEPDQRSVTYFDLPPGSYRFDVRARRPSADIVSAVASAQLDVGAAFYQRRAFPFTVGALVLSLFLAAFGARELVRHRREARLQGLVQTRTQRLERESERARFESDAKSRVLATVTHDLRSPLAVLFGYADLIRRTTDSDDIAQWSQRITSGATYMESMVTNILATATDVRQRSPLLPQAVSVPALIGELPLEVASGPELQRSANNFGQQRHYLDPDTIAPIIMNLVSNAVRYTNGDWVRVSATLIEGGELSDRIRFEVVDAGPGIDMSQDELAGGNTDPPGGFGLGLTIVGALLERYGSRLELDSQPGEPTSLSFELDVLDVANLPDPAPMAAIWVGDPVVRRRLSDAITLSGWQPTEVLSVDDARSSIGDGRADVMFVDDHSHHEVTGSELSHQVGSIVAVTDVVADGMVSTISIPALRAVLHAANPMSHQ